MNRTSFKTKAGTELPLLNLKGKEYLQVAHRIVWFREEHPAYSIETEAIEFTKDRSCVKATIRDQGGRVIAQAHKVEDSKGFGDHLEKAETGAIGRALALCGYGTQFAADDFDEKNRLADSPLERLREKQELYDWSNDQLREHIQSKYKKKFQELTDEEKEEVIQSITWNPKT